MDKKTGKSLSTCQFFYFVGVAVTVAVIIHVSVSGIAVVGVSEMVGVMVAVGVMVMVGVTMALGYGFSVNELSVTVYASLPQSWRPRNSVARK